VVYFLHFGEVELAVNFSPLLLLLDECALREDTQMPRNGLAGRVKTLGKGIGRRGLQRNKPDDGAPRGVGNGLKNVPSHGEYR